MDKIELADQILYDLTEEGETIADLAFSYCEDAAGVDGELYKAMLKINEGGKEFLARLFELNKEFDLEYEEYTPYD